MAEFRKVLHDRDGRVDTLEAVERLVRQDPDLLNAKDGEGRTPLMLACVWSDWDLALWLIDQGAAIHEQEVRSTAALWFACETNSTPVVQRLMDMGADPTIPADFGTSTPLKIAASDNFLEIVRLLLGHPSVRATINCRDPNGKTALWEACRHWNDEVIKLLLGHGADPTIADNDSTTCMAAVKGRYANRRLPEEARESVAVLEVSSSHPISLLRHPVCMISGLTNGLCPCRCVAGGAAGLSPMEGPAGSGCGCELRRAGGGGGHAGRGQAPARGGRLGGAEGSCGGRGRRGAAGRVGSAGDQRAGGGEEGGDFGACRAVDEAHDVQEADGDDGVT
jgi:hypothetical protein